MKVGVVSTPELAKRKGSELLCAHLLELLLDSKTRNNITHVMYCVIPHDSVSAKTPLQSACEYEFRM